MPLLVRVDVDRPYGKHPLPRHVLSRLSSDLYFPKVQALGYLDELEALLRLFAERKARAHIFFRQCTLPSRKIMAMLDEGGHQAGLHLEDSRSYETFLGEKRRLEEHLGRSVISMSKHGSGGAKFGRRHHAPYEPEKYVDWARRAGMKNFFGNLEDPGLVPMENGADCRFFPSAFWLEPSWRDTARFTPDWLVAHARERDIVLLVHPENVLESRELTDSLRELLCAMETKILS